MVLRLRLLLRCVVLRCVVLRLRLWRLLCVTYAGCRPADLVGRQLLSAFGDGVVCGGSRGVSPESDRNGLILSDFGDGVAESLGRASSESDKSGLFLSVFGDEVTESLGRASSESDKSGLILSVFGDGNILASGVGGEQLDFS